MQNTSLHCTRMALHNCTSIDEVLTFILYSTTRRLYRLICYFWTTVESHPQEYRICFPAIGSDRCWLISPFFYILRWCVKREIYFFIKFELEIIRQGKIFRQGKFLFIRLELEIICLKCFVWNISLQSFWYFCRHLPGLFSPPFPLHPIQIVIVFLTDTQLLIVKVKVPKIIPFPYP